MMKSLRVLTVLALFASLSAHATLLVYEGFDYSGASDVDGESGGTGWSGAWGISGGGSGVVAGYDASSLSNTAFTGAGFSSVGGALTNDHNTFAAQRDFNTVIDLDADGAVYFSYLINMSELTVRDDVQFTGTASSNPFEVRLNNEVAATGGSGTFQTTNLGLTAGTTYFVVGKITTAAGAGNDFMSAKVYASGDTVSATEEFDITSAGAVVTGTLTGIQFYQGDSANNDGDPTIYDEFRLGTTWESVAIPEPSSFVLVGLSMVAGYLSIRRRR